MTAEPLSPTTAAFLLVAHQTGVLGRVVKAPPYETVEANVVRLARAAAVLDMPLIFTTSEEDGQNGVLLPSLQQVLPAACASCINRHGIIDSLADTAVAQAVSATGRRQLITAGIGIEVCGLPPALHAHRDGYDPGRSRATRGAGAAGRACRRMEHGGVVRPGVTGHAVFEMVIGHSSPWTSRRWPPSPRPSPRSPRSIHPDGRGDHEFNRGRMLWNRRSAACRTGSTRR
jgi:hypothetical protein